MAAKTVLITGSNRGLGLAFVKHYTQQGWNVIATARNPQAADQLRALAPWKLVRMDVSSQDSIASAAQTLQSVPIDLLINNAGIRFKTGLNDVTRHALLHEYEINAVAPFLVTRALLANLRQAVTDKTNHQQQPQSQDLNQTQQPGIIANITSRNGSISDNTSGGQYGYRASKAALNMITKSLAVDLKQDNLAAVVVHPGRVKTDMNKDGDVTADQAVAGVARVLSQVTMKDSGKFFHYEGAILPW